MASPISLDQDTGLEIFTDHTGERRGLACLQPTEDHLKVRAGIPTLTQYLESQGLSLIPRDKWVEITHPTMGTEFINNQRSCNGCTGWSAAQAEMRMRAARGFKFVKLSGAYIYSQINGGRDAGSVITDSQMQLMRAGTCTEAEFDYPNIYASQARNITPLYKSLITVTVSTFDEIGTAIQMGFFPQFGVTVGGIFERFDSDGVAGYTRGMANHSVHGAGMKRATSGKPIVEMPNTWGAQWGPFGNGKCYLSEPAIAGAGMEGYVHIDGNDP